MLVSGIPIKTNDHARNLLKMGIEMITVIQNFNAETGYDLDLRVGIHSGPLVAGIIGKKKFVYDLWGDTVNIASRMESHGVPGQIQVSEATYQYLKDEFKFIKRDPMQIKGKGEMQTYLLDPSELKSSK